MASLTYPYADLSEDERKYLWWLRQALRLYLVPDRYVVLRDAGEAGMGDDEICLHRLGSQWIVYYVERGVESQKCYFDDLSNAVHYVFWTMTTKSPLNFKLSGVELPP